MGQLETYSSSSFIAAIPNFTPQPSDCVPTGPPYKPGSALEVNCVFLPGYCTSQIMCYSPNPRKDTNLHMYVPGLVVGGGGHYNEVHLSKKNST